MWRCPTVWPAAAPAFEADVVPVGTVLGVEAFLDDVDQRPQSAALLGRGLPPRRDQPAGDDEAVPWRHRIRVGDGEGNLVRREPVELEHGEER